MPTPRIADLAGSAVPSPSPSVTAIVDAVSRAVELERRPDRVDVTTSLRTVLADSPAQVWPELTDPARLARWYGPVEITGDADAGIEFSTVGGAHGRVITAEEPHLLRLTWEYGGHEDELEIRLDPEDDGSSRLRLEQVSSVPLAVFESYGPGATALGWDIAVLGLVSRTDAWRDLRLAVPAPDPAWLASAEGTELVRAWSIRWAAASVAAGTEEDLARRAEAGTTQAYGGAIAPAAV